MYPTNEKETIELYKSLQDELGWKIVHLQGPFPDAIIENDTGKQLVVEFEYEARNFKKHKHDKTGCDLIVCWRNNWIDAPLSVWALDQESAKTASVERFKQAYFALAVNFEKRVVGGKSNDDYYFMDKIIDLEDNVKHLEEVLRLAWIERVRLSTLWDYLGLSRLGKLRSKRKEKALEGAMLCPFCHIEMMTNCQYWYEPERHNLSTEYGYGNAIHTCPICKFKKSKTIHYGGDILP